MKFFLPKAEKANQEEIYQGIRTSVAEQTGWDVTDRRIYCIDYVHSGRALQARVGEVDEIQGEVVYVIFESQAYLVCTPNRGLLRDMPILVGKNEVHHVVEFED